MPDLKLTLVETMEDVEDFLRWLSQDRPFLGVDTESTGLILNKDKMRLIQFGDLTGGYALGWDDWLGVIKIVFQRYTGKMVYHFSIHDIAFMEAQGVRPYLKWNQIHDTLDMVGLRDNTTSKKLKEAFKMYADPAFAEGETELNKFFAKTGYFWDTVPIDAEPYWQYGILDAIGTAMVAENLWPNTQLYQEAYDLEMATNRVLTKMYLKGVKVDIEYTLKVRNEQRAQLKELLPELREHGIVENEDDEKPSGLNGVPTIVKAFHNIGVEVPTRLSKKGKVSIPDEVLDEMGHPLADKLKDARKAYRNITTYLNKIVEMNTPMNRVHPSVHPIESTSGRVSIKDPAINNLEKDPYIRDCIIADEGEKLVEIDYSNEELRIIGSLCNCQGMIEAFENGLDLHTRTASEAFHIPESEVSDKQRQLAKRSSFTLAYGGQAKKFSEYVGEGGAAIFNSMHALWPELKEYMNECMEQIQATKNESGYGYLTAIDGRRIWVPGWKSYTSLAHMSQQTGTIILKKDLVELDIAGLGDYLLLPVHDAIYFQFPEAEVDVLSKEAAEIMHCEDLRISLPVEISEPADRLGDWYRGKKYE